jgi:hypothetical protein
MSGRERAVELAGVRERAGDREGRLVRPGANRPLHRELADGIAIRQPYVNDTASG